MTLPVPTFDVPTFDNSYARLPETFFERLSPRVLPDAKLVHLNDSVANLLGLDDAQLRSEAGLLMRAGKLSRRALRRWRWPMRVTSLAASRQA